MSFRLIAIGLIGGVSAGLFGVGGGFLMVPLLMAWAKMDQRLASAASLLGIIPTALAGATLYAWAGQVSWIAALAMAGGALVGGLFGSWLIGRVSLGFLKWLLVAGLVAGAVRLVVETPVRDAVVTLDVATIIVLVILGLVMGMLAGLLGVGGGIIAVPVLIGLIGMGDLLAKGTSLLALIPGAISSSLGHVKQGLRGLKPALFLAPASLAGVFAGTQLAFTIPPDVGGYLFAALLLGFAIRFALQSARPPQPPESRQ